MNKSKIFLIGLIVIFAINSQNQAQKMERNEIDLKYKWNLKDIYDSDAEWEKAKNELKEEMTKIEDYKGKLASSSETLAELLELNSELSKKYVRLYSYAHMHSDQDTRVSKYLAMNQEISKVGTDFNSLSSYIEPEILSIEKEKLEGFIEKNDDLEPFETYLHDLQRKKEHTLSPKEEKILAKAGSMASSPASIFGVFSNSDLIFPQVTLSDGTKATLDQSGYAKHRASSVREDREMVFQEFWKNYDHYKNTFAEQLYSQIKGHIFYAETRKYESTLHRALDNYNIPTEVYHSLINNVNKNLKYFHRYLDIKKRLLGVDTLKYSDVYAPVVQDVDLDYNYDEGFELVIDAMKPLGKDYTEVLKTAYDKRWVDVYPTTGKRSGAYSQGAVYDVHPYILLNYNDKYNDVSTLAHELGHTMHSYLSNKNQPYPTSRYSIFVAEVASTFNEALLINKVLDEVKDDDARLSLLVQYLDDMKGTLFRQTQFAEFELAIHKKAEAGDPLTSDVLNDTYGEILKRYYGHNDNVCRIDDLYTVEWSYVPHFYYNYYVYQYATAFTASTALAEKVINKEDKALDKYLNFLGSGSSKYPIDLLKDAGVDMTTDDPFLKAMEVMSKTMDEVEKILEKKGL